MLPSPAARRIAVAVKGYPRLSETFIAQEILALEQRGIPLEIWSLRHPTERAVHPMNRKIKARVTYLPEYLYEEPVRVLRGVEQGHGPRLRRRVEREKRRLHFIAARVEFGEIVVAEGIPGFIRCGGFAVEALA